MNRTKEWFNKNKRLNKDYELQVGDLFLSDHWQKDPKQIWEVLEITPEDESDHGLILARKVDSPYNLEDYYSEELDDIDVINNNFEQFANWTDNNGLANWKRNFRIFNKNE